MNYKVFPPSVDLKGIVKNFIVVESLENIERLLFLPNGGNFIFFNRGMKAYTMSYCNSEVFRIPKSYSVSMKSNKVTSIVLDESHEDKDELNYLNKSLANMSNTQCDKHLCIENAVEKINNEFFYIKIKDLLDEFKCSKSTLERQFKKMVGLTPKRFIMVAKFCKTFLEYVEGKRTFHELQYIYSDNSHMNSVFQNMLGIAPSEILARVEKNEVNVYQINNIRYQT